MRILGDGEGGISRRGILWVSLHSGTRLELLVSSGERCDSRRTNRPSQSVWILPKRTKFMPLTAPSGVKNSSSFSVSRSSVVKYRSKAKKDLRGIALMSRYLVKIVRSVSVEGICRGRD